MKRIKQHNKRQRGVALIEFAISIWILIIIVFGISEFGRAIFQYNTLAKAARDATRFLSTKAPGDAIALAEARCLAVYGRPTCTGSPLIPNLTTSMVSICDASNCVSTHKMQGSSPVVNLVSITLGGPDTPYTFNSAVPFVLPDIPFGAISVTMRQVL